jgi:hypothetical protein
MGSVHGAHAARADRLFDPKLAEQDLAYEGVWVALFFWQNSAATSYGVPQREQTLAGATMAEAGLISAGADNRGGERERNEPGASLERGAGAVPPKKPCG